MTPPKRAQKRLKRTRKSTEKKFSNTFLERLNIKAILRRSKRLDLRRFHLSSNAKIIFEEWYDMPRALGEWQQGAKSAVAVHLVKKGVSWWCGKNSRDAYLK